MKRAKLLVNGQNQVVRLPDEFRFDGDEVFIKKTENGVLLISKNQFLWDTWEKNLSDKPHSRKTV